VKRVGGRDPVVLRGGMGAKALAVELSRPKPQPSVPTVATGPYIREASAGPDLDTLRVAAPIAFKGCLVQCAGCILRLHPGKTTADPRLPRPVNRRPRRVAGQAFPRLHWPRLPRPLRLVAETSTCRQERPGQDT